MNLNNKLKGVSDEFDLSHREMLRIVYSDIENDLTSFRMEIKDAANVETLEFLRRHFWDRLFSENGGVYYELCMRSPMLKILRLNADIRYCQLLKQKQRKESQQVNFIIRTRTQTIREKQQQQQQQQQSCQKQTQPLDGELEENEIFY